MSGFTERERRRYRLKNHLKTHWFAYALDCIGPAILAAILLYVCKAQEILPGIVMAFVYGLGKTCWSIRHFIKDNLEREVQE